MNPRSHNLSLALLLSLYLFTSQATVLALVLQWYSTGAHQTVQMRFGATQEQAELRWSPRTHVPLTQQSEFSPSEPVNPLTIPVVHPVEQLRDQPPRALSAKEFFALLANKAPPLA